VEGRPPDLEVIDDITDKRIVHRVLEHRLGDSRRRRQLLRHLMGHINLFGEYDFSDEKLPDSIGIPPKNRPEITR
jgi:hypothetical protein